MHEYHVTISDEAKADVLSIYHYIRDELCAPQAAEDLFDRFAKAFLSLSIFPERGSVLSVFKKRGHTFRQLLVKKYRIIYYIEENEVIILAVVYGSRHLDHL